MLHTVWERLKKEKENCSDIMIDVSCCGHTALLGSGVIAEIMPQDACVCLCIDNLTIAIPNDSKFTILENEGTEIVCQYLDINIVISLLT